MNLQKLNTITYRRAVSQYAAYVASKPGKMLQDTIIYGFKSTILGRVDISGTQ